MPNDINNNNKGVGNNQHPLTVSKQQGATNPLIEESLALLNNPNNIVRQGGLEGIGTSGIVGSGMSVEEANKYEKYGVNPTGFETQEELDIQRAKGQSALNQFGNAVGQALWNEVLLGTIRGFSDIFDMAVNAARGEGNDYTNALSRQIEEWQTNVRENILPIYQQVNDGKFHPLDFGWWMNGAVSSATTVSLMLPGLGVGKGLSALGKVGNIGAKTSKAIRQGLRAAKVANAGKVYHTIKGATEIGGMALISRTAENYQEARETYKNVYDKAASELANMSSSEKEEFVKRNGFDGMSDEEMIETIASTSAGKTFYNDYWMLLMDIPQFKALSSIWKGAGVANKATTRALRRANEQQIEKLIGRKLTEETAETAANTFAKRITSGDILENLGKGVKNVWTSTEGLMLGEGVEEGFQGIQSQRGEEYGELYFNPYLQRKGLGDYLKDETVWEQAFWGVMGGLLFQAAGKGFRKLEDKTRAKLDKDNKTDNEIKALAMGEDKARAEEIYGRFQLMDNFKDKINTIQQGKNPYDIKRDKNGHALVQNGQLQYEDIKSVEDVNRLKTQALNDFITEFTLNAADKGNYDLLKEFVSNKEFSQYFKDSGVDTDELMERELVNKMDEIYDEYQKAYYDVVDNTDSYNEYITRLAARDVVRKKIDINSINERVDNLNALLDEEELSDKQKYEQIAKQRVIASKLEQIDNAINQVNENYRNRETFYSKQAYEKELAELNNQKNNLYKQLQNINSAFNYSDFAGTDIEQTLKNVEEFYNNFLANNVLTTSASFDELGDSVKSNLYAKASYEVYRQELIDDLPTSDNKRKYYTNLYEQKEAMFLDLANSKFNIAFDRVSKYIKSKDNIEETVQNLLKGDLDLDTSLSDRQKRLLEDSLEVLRFGAYDRQSYNSALLGLLATETSRRERENEQQEEVKTEEGTVRGNVGQKINNPSSTGKTQNTPSQPAQPVATPTNTALVEQEPIIPQPVEEDSIITRDDNNYSAEEGELTIDDVAGFNKLIEDEDAERLSINKDDFPMISASDSAEKIIQNNKTLWQSTVKDGRNSQSYKQLLDMIIENMIVVNGNSVSVANEYAEKGLMLHLNMIVHAGQNIKTSTGKQINKLYESIRSALGFDEKGEHSLFGDLDEKEALSRKNAYIRDIFEEFIRFSNIKTSNLTGTKVIDLVDVFKEISQMFDDNNMTYDSILYLYKDISNFVNSYDGNEYTFVNKDFLNANQEDFIDRLYKAKTEEVSISPFMHFSSSINSSNNDSGIQELTDAEKLRIIQASRDKPVRFQISNDKAGNHQSISLVVNYNGQAYEIGYTSWVNIDKTNTKLTSKYNGLETTVSKNSEGNIVSSNDYLFNEILNNDSIYRLLATRFIKDYSGIFYGKDNVALISKINSKVFSEQEKELFLNNPAIKKFIEENNLNATGSVDINKVMRRINDILFYDMKKIDNTEGAAESRFNRIINNIGFKESYRRFKEKQYDNFIQCKEIQDRLEQGEEVNAILKSDDVGKIRYDVGSQKNVNRIGISKTISEHPVIYYDGTKGIDENGKIYANITGLKVGSMAIVMGENQGEYILNDDGTYTNRPGANIAFINGSNPVVEKTSKTAGRLHDAVIEHLTNVIENYYNDINDSSKTVSSKNAAFEKLYNELNSLFGTTETKLFNGFVVSMTGNDTITIAKLLNDGTFANVAKIYKFKKLGFKNGSRIDSEGNIVQGDALNDYFGGAMEFNIPDLQYRQFGYEGKARKDRVNKFINYLADNIVFNKSRFAITNSSQKNTDKSHIYKEDGKIVVEVGSFKESFDSYAQMAVKMNMFTTTQQGKQGYRYEYENNKIPRSFFVDVRDTVAPKTEEEKERDKGLSAWIEKNGISDGETVTTNEVLEAIGIREDKRLQIIEFNNTLQRNTGIKFFSDVIKINEELTREEKFTDENGDIKTRTIDVDGRYVDGDVKIGKSAIRKTKDSKSESIILRLLIHENVHRIIAETNFFANEIGQQRITDINNIFDEFYTVLSTDKTKSVEVRELKNKFRKFKQEYESNEELLANEFIAEVLSSESLRNYLNQIETEESYETETGVEKKSLLQKIIDFILKLFNIEGSINNRSVLAEFYNALGDVSSSDTIITKEGNESSETSVSTPVEGELQETEDNEDDDFGLIDYDILDSRFEQLTADEIMIETINDSNNPFNIDKASDMDTYMKQIPSFQRAEMAVAMRENKIKYVCR